MGILDTASEVELIIGFALTSPYVIGFRDGVLVPVTDEARAAAGTFTNPVDGQPYYYQVSPPDLERWVNDALEEQLGGTFGTLPYTILRSLKEECRRGMRFLDFPDRNPSGLLLDPRRLLETLDEIWSLVVLEHRLAWKVVPRLTTVVWKSSLWLAQPNVTIRLARPETMVGLEQPIGRAAIEDIVSLVRTALLQDAVPLRARHQGDEWRSVLFPGELEGQVELQEMWEVAPVRLRYRYKVLPPELFTRLIVRISGLSDGALYQQREVVLRDGDASALIRADVTLSELHIFVLGGDEDARRILVTMVRRELEVLHGALNIAAVEELELTGDSEQWVSVRFLREIEDPRAPRQRLPVRSEGNSEVNVARELDKLEPAESRAINRDPNTAPIPVRIFVSYAHGDERQLQRLNFVLDVLEYYHHLKAWDDQRLIAGEAWDAEIRRRLEEMDIFLFVASQRSLVRPYIRETELRRAVERWQAGEVEIVTLKLEPCATDEDPVLGKLQRLATGYRSILEANRKPVAWEQVRQDLLQVIERVREKKRMSLSSG